MDDKDRMLLSALRRDARRSAVALAREVQLSRSTVQERIERLRASGAIKSFTIVEGESSQRQSAHFLAQLRPGFTCSQLLPVLRRVPGIVCLHSSAGQYDMIVRADGDSIDSIEAVRKALAGLSQIAEVVTLVTLDRHIG